MDPFTASLTVGHRVARFADGEIKDFNRGGCRPSVNVEVATLEEKGCT